MTDSFPAGTSDSAWYSVSAAARKLGISDRAVRARISAGTIHAQREGSRWLVTLPGGIDVAGISDSGRKEPATAKRNVSDSGSRHFRFRQPETGISPVAQLAALRDEWVLPFLDRIADAERRAGELAGRLEARDAEVAELRAQLAGFQREGEQSHVHAGAGAVRGSWWLRLRSVRGLTPLFRGRRPENTPR